MTGGDKYTYWEVVVDENGTEYRRQLDKKPSNPKSDYVVSSRTPEGLHRLAIDVDFPVRCVPSRTAGHYHLYFDGMEPVNFHKYADLLRSLANAGIIEWPYAMASIRRGMTMLRGKPDVHLPSDKPKCTCNNGYGKAMAVCFCTFLEEDNKEPVGYYMQPLIKAAGFVRSYIGKRFYR